MPKWQFCYLLDHSVSEPTTATDDFPILLERQRLHFLWQAGSATWCYMELVIENGSAALFNPLRSQNGNLSMREWNGLDKYKKKKANYKLADATVEFYTVISYYMANKLYHQCSWLHHSDIIKLAKFHVAIMHLMPSYLRKYLYKENPHPFLKFSTFSLPWLKNNSLLHLCLSIKSTM